MAKPTKSPRAPSEADKERSHAFALKRLEVVTTVIKYGFVCGTVVGCLYVGVALPIKYSAGQTTIIQFMVDWIKDLKLGTLFAYGLAGSAMVWAYRERTKRLKERSEKDERLIEYETRIDPNRTSSGLLVDGGEPLKGDQ